MYVSSLHFGDCVFQCQSVVSHNLCRNDDCADLSLSSLGFHEAVWSLTTNAWGMCKVWMFVFHTHNQPHTHTTAHMQSCNTSLMQMQQCKAVRTDIVWLSCSKHYLAHVTSRTLCQSNLARLEGSMQGCRLWRSVCVCKLTEMQFQLQSATSCQAADSEELCVQTGTMDAFWLWCFLAHKEQSGPYRVQGTPHCKVKPSGQTV